MPKGNVSRKNNVNRYFGLGKTPEQFGLRGGGVGMGALPVEAEMASLRQAFDVNFTMVPPIEYVAWTMDLPLTNPDIAGTFSEEIDLFANNKSVPGVENVDSSFVQNGQLQVDMLCVGFGVHIFGEPLSFSTIGNALTPSPEVAYAPPVSPDTMTVLDNTAAIMGWPAGTTSYAPAVLQWGQDAWNAGWHMANAYQFNWTYQQRTLLVDELCADVAYWGSYAESVAAGTSDVPIQPYVRRINQHYRDLGAGAVDSTFVPVNARRVGILTTGAYRTLMRPTRDFDLAPATWGGLKHQQGVGSGGPFRRLVRPVLLERGIPIGMFLRLQNSYHRDQMVKHMSVANGTIGQSVCADSLMTDATGGGAAIFLELSSDAAPVAVAQTVPTCRTVFKGGALKVAILIKGFEIWGEWKRYIDQLASLYNPQLSMSGGPAYRFTG